jgi:hydrogenase nickel incorporation protein HypA/HybF
MHELGVTMEIVDAAALRAAGRAVRKVRVEVGRLAAIMPDALRFCFEVCAKDTVVEGAELILEWVPGRGRCRACDTIVELHVPYGVCSCGAHDLELVSGHEIVVVDMEVV